MSILDRIAEERRQANLPKKLNASGRKHVVSGKGKGKWHSNEQLAAYCRKRDAKRKGK